MRAELANRLAPIPNAPIAIVKSLAEEDSAEVATPVLAQSARLDDAYLVSIASRKSQQHLLAISTRSLAETVVALSLLSGVPQDGVERSMRDDRPDMLFMLAKASGLHWHAAKAIYLLQTQWRKISDAELEQARRSFLQLQAATAQRIVTFIKARHAIMKVNK